jgi:hypothetical protein
VFVKIRLTIAVLASTFAVLLFAKPAAAQDGIDVAAGWQYLKFAESGGESIPAGWGASVAGGSRSMKLVGEVGGNYKDGGKIHTFQGGGHFGGSGTFVELLAGLMRFQGEGGGRTDAFVFTPQVGVDIGGGAVGGRVMAGFPIARADGETHKFFRVFAGVVIRSH